MDGAPDDWLSAPEAATYLGVSRPRIHQLAGHRAIDARRLAGRLFVHRPSLDAWANSRGRLHPWRPTNLRELRFKRAEILALADEHGAGNVRVFGSLARAEAGPSSDVDLAVDLAAGRTALDVGELAVALEETLGCDVDLIVTSPPYGDSVAFAGVLADAVPL